MRQHLTHNQQIAADTEWLARREREDAGKAVVVRPTCESCRAFTADAINPPSGMGTCAKGHTAVYPMQRRNCPDFKQAAR